MVGIGNVADKPAKRPRRIVVAAALICLLGLFLGPLIVALTVALALAIRDAAAADQGGWRAVTALAAGLALCGGLSCVTFLAAAQTFREQRGWRVTTTRLMLAWSCLLVLLALGYGMYVVRPAISRAFGTSWLASANSILFVTVSTFGAMLPAAIPQVVIRLLRDPDTAGSQ